MLIQPKAVSPAISAVIRRNLTPPMARQYLAESAGGASVEEVALSLPHDVYFMRLDDIAEGKSLDSAYPTGTRVLVSDGTQQVYAIAEVDKAENPQFLQLDRGPFLQPLLEGLEKFDDRHRITGIFHDLELRLLRIPSLYVVTIWLHSQDNRNNLIIPIGQTPQQLTTNQVYSPEEFLEQLRDIAKRQLEDTKGA